MCITTLFPCVRQLCDNNKSLSIYYKGAVHLEVLVTQVSDAIYRLKVKSAMQSILIYCIIFVHTRTKISRKFMRTKNNPNIEL